MVLPLKVRTSPSLPTGEHSLWKPLWNTTHSCISLHHTWELNLAMWSSLANRMLEVCRIAVCFPLDLHDPVILATWGNWETQGISRMKSQTGDSGSVALASSQLCKHLTWAIMEPSLVIVCHCVWNERARSSGVHSLRNNGINSAGFIVGMWHEECHEGSLLHPSGRASTWQVVGEHSEASCRLQVHRNC